MPDGTAESVLERKAQAQRRSLGVGGLSVHRALGRSLSIAADALWALGLVAQATRDDTLPTDLALARLPEDALLLILENDAGSCGLLALDRSVVTSLIEVQTLGKVSRFPLDDRPFTATDAAMTAPLVDAALPRFGAMLEGQPERAHLQGFRFGAQVDDVQTAGLALDGDSHHMLSFDVSLAQDTRVGKVAFLFPEPEPSKATDDASSIQLGKHAEAMKRLPARMRAVLTRIHVPLSKAQSLKPGDLLEISPAALNATSLVVDGGYVVAKGKLGQINGFRAIRIGGDAPLLQQADRGDAARTTPKVSAKQPKDAVTDTAFSDAVNVEAPLVPQPMDMSLDDLALGLDDLEP
ncbi:FliM/FliN family flagellar motor switch protein [Marivita hallyeonensis]|nr:flagellar motor switch protein FliM [Marivita hallyeonensis]